MCGHGRATVSAIGREADLSPMLGLLAILAAGGTCFGKGADSPARSRFRTPSHFPVRQPDLEMDRLLRLPRAVRVRWRLDPGMLRVTDARVTDRLLLPAGMIEERRERRLVGRRLGAQRAAERLERERAERRRQERQAARVRRKRLRKKRRRIF